MVELLLVAVSLLPPSAGRTDLYGDPLPEGAVARFGSVRFRHPGFAASAALPDGKTVVSAGGDRKLRYVDLETGKPTKVVELRGEWAYLGSRTTFSDDGKLLASSLSRVVVWDAETGKELFVSAALNTSPEFLRFSPDGETLACGLESPRRVTFLDWRANKSRSVDLPEPRGNGDNLDREASFTPDGKWLAVGGWHAPDVRVVDVTAGKVAYTVPGASRGWGFSPDGKILLVVSDSPGGAGSLIRRIDPPTGKELSRSEPAEWYAGPVRFTPDGKRVALATLEGTAVLDPATGEAVSIRTGRVRDCAFTPDGKSLLAGTRVWDAATGKARSERPGEFTNSLSAAVSPDGRTVAAPAFEENEVALWDVASGRLRLTLPLGYPGMGVRGLTFTRDRKSLVTGSQEGLVQFWNPHTGAEQRSVQLRDDDRKKHKVFYSEMHVSADGRRAVTVEAAGYAHQTGRVKVWDLASGEKAAEYSRPGPLQKAAWPDGSAAVVLLEDAGLSLRVPGEDRPALRFPGSAGGRAVATSPDGRLVASPKVLDGRSSQQQVVGVWEVASGREVAAVPGGSDPAVALAGDNRTLVVVNNGTMTVWDLATGKARGSRPVHHEPGPGARSGLWVLVTPDGRRAVTPTSDGTAVVWDLAPFAPRPLGAGAAVKDVAAWWADLAKPDAPAYPAVWRLCEAGGPAVALLKEHLRPVPALTAERFRTLVAELGDDDFEVRERATRELTEFGQAAAASVRDAIKTTQSAEVQRRLDGVLRKIDRPAPPGEELRAVRAVEVLERVGSPEARELLDKLAGGAEGAAVTRAAKAARGRLGGP